MKMRADEAVRKYGESLVGRLVVTERLRNWPGGLCKVKELSPDPAAPDIVMQVMIRDDEEKECGVFANEIVEVY